jgi:hypothetical protein
MVSRFQAGRVRQVRVRAAAPRPRLEAGARLWPCRFAWLVRDVGWEAAGFGCQLRAVLETPEMVAFLAACPQAMRVLRPVCRMLAIEAQAVRPGVETPRADAPVRAARAQPDLGCVPIPRGVMAWVRRERSAKR